MHELDDAELPLIHHNRNHHEKDLPQATQSPFLCQSERYANLKVRCQVLSDREESKQDPLSGLEERV